MAGSRGNERLHRARPWIALLFLAAMYWIADPVESAIYGPIAKAFALRAVANNELLLQPLTLVAVIRLCIALLIAICVIAILGRSVRGFPLTGPARTRRLLLGFAIGLFVMTAAILAIILTGNAAISVSHQSAASALGHVLGWLVFEFLGAAGEEFYGRVAVLLVAERLVGWRGALIVSGLWFLVIHLGNPGASPIWLVRLFFQGVLLAYAVYRTGSVWWSVGYHTGWNWATAPIFGAAGSGYLVRGHAFDFVPNGSDLITGGTVGPEGSIFAFAAMLLAFGLLIASTPRATKSLASRDSVRQGVGTTISGDGDERSERGRRDQQGLSVAADPAA